MWPLSFPTPMRCTDPESRCHREASYELPRQLLTPDRLKRHRSSAHSRSKWPSSPQESKRRASRPTSTPRLPVSTQTASSGMRLQADPTVKFATGDFHPRIRGRHLSLKSPYNTYLNAGLPPGPIRGKPTARHRRCALCPGGAHIYIGAKPHFWAIAETSPPTYQTHRANARRYKRRSTSVASK